jgi:uncharacterized circularly permuted ATP-grasp superfamily protein/uncharacterized alpha-E superfamily protein
VSAQSQQQTASAQDLVRPELPFDEFRGKDRTVRAHQRLLDEFLSARSPQDIDQLERVIKSRINEQEVTFNILGVPEGTNRPWQLDALPFVLDRSEWQALCVGLRQRACLLDAVLTDCYGPQRLIRDGVLPAQLVLGHPRFLRDCRSFRPQGGHYLYLYAADLGRDASGRFYIYSDRTQAPTGAGYALENRLVLGRALPELFRAYQVERIAAFYAKVRRTVEALSPRGPAEQPRVVLLSAGASDESSFEHAYLARYLGYELVEGRDLTVRDRVVYLKTLSGLRRVDVLLRRVADANCDPLLLRGDPMQGAAGLVGAAAAGNVGLANPLGSALTESAAFKAYLPALCRHILGQDLAIDSVPTYWCGDAEALEVVLSSLDDFVVKPAFADRVGEPFVPAELDRDARSGLVARLKAHPSEFVAERWPSLSVVPVWSPGRMQQGKVALRTFLCRDGDDYDVLPGGLARINESPDGLFLALGSSAASKDVWIPDAGLGAGHAIPAMPDARAELRRGGLDMPSRLLDDIYWLGRYVERCESTARLARAGFERIGSESSAEASAAIAGILAALQAFGVAQKVVATGKSTPPPGVAPSSAEALLMGVLFDADSDNLRGALGRIHQLTLSVRSRLSRDAWHVLRKLTSALDGYEPAADRPIGSAIETLDQLLITLAAVSGTTLDNMVRGHAWVFLDMGRRVERGALTLSLIQALLTSGAGRTHMEALLEAADSLLTYRARYLSTLQAAPVVDLVLLDATNPRSVVFQVEALKEHLRRLPSQGEALRSRAERRLIALESSLLTADIEQACAGDGSGLRALLEECTVQIWQFSEDLGNTWFSHLEPSRALSPPIWVDEDLEAR